MFVELSAAELKQVTHVYSELPRELPHGPACRWEEVVSGKKTMEEFVGGLTDEQLAYLCIGAYKECGDMMEVIGNASISVAGAAGETDTAAQGAGDSDACHGRWSGRSGA